MARSSGVAVAVVLLGGGALAWIAHARTTRDAGSLPLTSTRPFAKRLALAGVENAALVAPGIYRGAQPTDEGYQELKKLGVKTIISLRTLHSEEEAVKKAGLEPLAIPLQADVRGSAPPTPEQVKAFLSALADPAKKPIYFHCAHGQDRTGTMCAVYRMEVDGWSPDDAFAEMQHFGFNDIWVDLASYVKAYKRTGVAAVGSR